MYPLRLCLCVQEAASLSAAIDEQMRPQAVQKDALFRQQIMCPPAGGRYLYQEREHNPTNENSAISINFHVRPVAYVSVRHIT